MKTSCGETRWEAAVEAQVKDDGDLIGDARNLEGRDGLRKSNGSYNLSAQIASVNTNHVNILVFFPFCLPFFICKDMYSWPSIFMGSTSVDSTNCR